MLDGTPDGVGLLITKKQCVETPHGSYVSIGVMMAGIILARFGLWNLDLTITQILQVCQSTHAVIRLESVLNVKIAVNQSIPNIDIYPSSQNYRCFRITLCLPILGFPKRYFSIVPTNENTSPRLVSHSAGPWAYPGVRGPLRSSYFILEPSSMSVLFGHIMWYED